VSRCDLSTNRTYPRVSTPVTRILFSLTPWQRDAIFPIGKLQPDFMRPIKPRRIVFAVYDGVSPAGSARSLEAFLACAAAFGDPRNPAFFL